MVCSVCRNPKAPEILAKVWNEEMTLADAARHLGVSYQLLWHHMRFHEGRKPAETSADVDAIAVLREITDILKERLDQLRGLPVGIVVNERMITMLTRDLRETIMDLERLTGRLRSAPLIQLQQINVHYEQLLTFIVRELCSECRKKARKWLEVSA